jgi:hypothetical protein
MEKEFHCTHCGTPTPASNTKAIDVERKVARCASCKQTFDIAFQLEGLPDQRAASAKRSLSNHNGAVSVTENEGIFTLVHRWAHPTSIGHLLHLGRLFLCTVLVGAAVFFLLKLGWDGLVPFVSLGLLGVLLGYSELAGMLNSTRIDIASGRLKTEHGPLPWPCQLDLACADIKQFFVKKRVVKTRGTETYTLCAVLSDNRKIAVLPKRLVSDDLSFVETALESHLAIVDRVVPND